MAMVANCAAAVLCVLIRAIGTKRISGDDVASERQGFVLWLNLLIEASEVGPCAHGDFLPTSQPVP